MESELFPERLRLSKSKGWFLLSVVTHFIGRPSSFRHKFEWLRNFVPLGSGEGKEKADFPPCTRIQSNHLNLVAQAAGQNSFSKADLNVLLSGFKE